MVGTQLDRRFSGTMRPEAVSRENPFDEGGTLQTGSSEFTISSLETKNHNKRSTNLCQGSGPSSQNPEEKMETYDDYEAFETRNVKAQIARIFHQDKNIKSEIRYMHSALTNRSTATVSHYMNKYKKADLIAGELSSVRFQFLRHKDWVSLVRSNDLREFSLRLA